MIDLIKGQREQEGSCNSCGTREEDTVISILVSRSPDSLGISMRFCPACFAQLNGLITQHFCRFCGSSNPNCQCWNDE